ncbi:hypothetical protein CsSME_00040189 [Camellia sinensis var. sinensis]
MGKFKAPGPDGYIAGFYQTYWATVGQSVSEAVLGFLNSSNLFTPLNQTFICLIPKTKSPLTVNDYRPISLCNVMYKIGAKVLANRLSSVLPDLISDNQCAFLKGHLISDNVLLAHEHGGSCPNPIYCFRKFYSTNIVNEVLSLRLSLLRHHLGDGGVYYGDVRCYYRGS